MNMCCLLTDGELISRFASPAECFMGSSQTPVIFAWSVGISGYCVTNNTGYRIGATSYTHIMLEVSDCTINFNFI